MNPNLHHEVLIAAGQGLPSVLNDRLREAGIATLVTTEYLEVPVLSMRPNTVLVLLEPSSMHLSNYRLCRAVKSTSNKPLWIVGDSGGLATAEMARLVGVDDMFDVREIDLVVERVKQFLAAGKANSVETSLGLVVDSARRRVSCDGKAVSLTRTEFDLLEALADQLDRVVRRDALIEQVWGAGWFGAANVLDTHLSHLRQKLQRAGFTGAIETVRGVGFLLEGDVRSIAAPSLGSKSYNDRVRV